MYKSREQSITGGSRTHRMTHTQLSKTRLFSQAAEPQLFTESQRELVIHVPCRHRGSDVHNELSEARPLQ